MLDKGVASLIKEHLNSSKESTERKGHVKGKLELDCYSRTKSRFCPPASLSERGRREGGGKEAREVGLDYIAPSAMIQMDFCFYFFPLNEMCIYLEGFEQRNIII